MSPLTELYMNGIVSFFEYMNEYCFMQRCYINGGGGGGRGGGKTPAPPSCPILP